MNLFRLPHLPVCLLLTLGLAGMAHAQSVCVFDPEGDQGGAFQQAQLYKKQAESWGVTLDLKSYVNEDVAVENFKAGQCDMMVVTGPRVGEFNKFAATLDSLGGVGSYQEMQDALKLIAAKPDVVVYTPFTGDVDEVVKLLENVIASDGKSWEIE